MKFLKTLVASTLGSLLAIGVLLFFGFLFLFAIAAASDQRPPVSTGSVMTIDLRGTLPEQVSGDPLTQLILGESAIDIHKLKNAIEAAADDSRIDGIWIRTGGMVSSWATLETLRRSLLQFKESGKGIVASSTVHFMTEAEYFVASVADSVFLDPEGVFEFNGFAFTSTFYGGLLDKLDVTVEVVRAGNFKSAVEPYTRTDMSEANKEQLQALVDGMDRSFVSSVAASRNMSEDQVRQLMDTDIMFFSRDALDKGLVDELLYEDEIQQMLRGWTGQDADEKLRTVSAANFASQIRAPRATDKIAVVHITGMMIAGSGSTSPLGGGSVAASRTVAKSIQQARDRSGVKAMVIRVNSPGGFAPAGDAMLREIQRTAEKMPVIISMGDAAASGGYWIATGGEYIFAEKNTTTGSIGVFSVFFDTSDLLEDRLGITFDHVATGPSADMFSGVRGYSPAERAMMQRSTESTYTSFLEKVAESRSMTVDEVDAIAGGRVWTGEDALKIGLVDELGGLDAAIAYAAKRAELSPDDVQVVRYPGMKTFVEQMASSPLATVRSMTELQDWPLASEMNTLTNVLAEQGKPQALWPYSISIR
jgi:protease-4